MPRASEYYGSQRIDLIEDYNTAKAVLFSREELPHQTNGMEEPQNQKEKEMGRVRGTVPKIETIY